eukprot:9484125-Pyramimonas_sp.AAC.1
MIVRAAQPVYGSQPRPEPEYETLRHQKMELLRQQRHLRERKRCDGDVLRIEIPADQRGRIIIQYSRTDERKRETTRRTHMRRRTRQTRTKNT